MKASFGKLRRFALHKTDSGKEKRDLLSTAQLDELAQASREMQDMRDCYDSLLSAAAATANSAYEFSESLREMGSCLMEKTALHDDEESGRLFSKLGKVQLELEKLLDRYRSHIFLTITKPSESLLNELRTVEDMKRQCDEKREVYEYMIAQHKEKGRSNAKGESITSHQLRTAQEDFNEEATLFVFRLKSLKQGQARSLLTQAARHHAAQLDFFHKGLHSLETVEPHVSTVAEHQHIDYQFSELGDDVEDGEYDSGNDQDTSGNRELSFDYRVNKEGTDGLSVSKNSTEADESDISFPRRSTAEDAARASSHSAPLFLEQKSDVAERFRHNQPSAPRKSVTYVLPVPTDTKNPASPKTMDLASNARRGNHAGIPYHVSYSSPLEHMKHGKEDYSDDHQSSVVKEKPRSSISTQLPPPLPEGLQISHYDTSIAYDTQKPKIYAFSGPIMSKQSSTLSRLPLPQLSTSPKISPNASPPLALSPKISELHELPRPPSNLTAKPAKYPGVVGHSAPLVSKNLDHSAANRFALARPSAASPLPTPPLSVPRSYSIPSRSHRAMALGVSKLLNSSRETEKGEEIDSPPLTPMSLANMNHHVPPVRKEVPQRGSIRGGN